MVGATDVDVVVVEGAMYTGGATVVVVDDVVVVVGATVVDVVVVVVGGTVVVVVVSVDEEWRPSPPVERVGGHVRLVGDRRRVPVQ